MENVRESENAVRADINGCHLLLIFEEQPVEGVFENMKGAPEEAKYKEILKKQQAAHAVSRRKLAKELEKNQKQLEVLQAEIAKTLLGESLYTPEDLREAISVVKTRIAEAESKIEKLDSEMCQKEEMTKAVLPAYRRFKSWAEEFDTADLEQKKMISCQLFDRIELGKNYEITLHMNVTYKQFCSEWDEAEESREAV